MTQTPVIKQADPIVRRLLGDLTGAELGLLAAQMGHTSCTLARWRDGESIPGIDKVRHLARLKGKTLLALDTKAVVGAVRKTDAEHVL